MKCNYCKDGELKAIERHPTSDLKCDSCSALYKTKIENNLDVEHITYKCNGKQVPLHLRGD